MDGVWAVTDIAIVIILAYLVYEVFNGLPPGEV